MSNRPSFITGSHAYGIPRPNSDIDLVVLVGVNCLRKLCENGQEGSRVLAEGDGKAFYGKLNLILVTNEREYELWAKGTAELQLRALTKPVTREEAKAHFTAMGLTNQVSQDKMDPIELVPMESNSDGIFGFLDGPM